ncbi:MAG: very short patch repair endonuclease [Muribaculum sp.]|nr:very short patch repair endonuclease [Muribaculum sp.]
MADVMTTEQRSRCMSHIKSKDTKPEMIVRRYIHAHGFRYGLHNPKLPGKPDIVLRRLKTVIFIHGCFWHGHNGCRYYRPSKSNIEFWETKITGNISRDKRNLKELNRLGWRVITVWECELKNKAVRVKTLSNLVRELNDISNGTNSFPHSRYAEAAEPEVEYGKH